MYRAVGVLGLLIGLAIIALGGGVLWQGQRLLDRASWTKHEGFIGSSGRISTSDSDDTVSVFWYPRPRAEDPNAEPEHGDMRVGHETFNRLIFGAGAPTSDDTIYVYEPTIGPTLACAERVFDDCAERSRLPWGFALAFGLVGAFVIWMAKDRLR